MHPSWRTLRSLIPLACLNILSARGIAAEDAARGNSRAAWIQNDSELVLAVPLTALLTAKQRAMIDGGFTTMSQFDILRPTEAGDTVETVLWSTSCTVKFDAWEESYEVTRFRSVHDSVKSDTMLLRKFADYGDFCLTARVPLNDEMVKLADKGEKLIGRLTVQQMNAEEGARIKEWLVKQQSGLMQSLFKHMLGELALHQSLTVTVSIPALPPDAKQKLRDDGPTTFSPRGS